MLKLLVTISESYNEETNKFLYERVELQLEHSLASMSKWEGFFKKPFFDEGKTSEEVLWYINAMSLTGDIPAEVLNRLSEENVQAINEYIADNPTATWFKDSPRSNVQGTKITAEIIYYLMFTYHIALECEHWHLNRLLAQIRVFNEKNAPPKKLSKAEQAQSQRELNAQRRAAMNSKG